MQMRIKVTAAAAIAVIVKTGRWLTMPVDTNAMIDATIDA